MINKITFRKPGMINTSEFSYVDMHFHTKYSDGRAKILKVIKKCRKRGFGIAITDHNDIRGSVSASKYSNVMTIPGIEVGVKEGAHLLFYFYNIEDLEDFYIKNVKDNRPKDPMSNLKVGIHEIIEEGRKYNAITCAPHPYSKTGRIGLNKAMNQKRISQEIFNNIQLIEVINGQSLKKYDIKAAILANNLGKGITGGSDGHTKTELGKVLTYTNKVETREQFLEELIKKRSNVIGKQLNLAARVVPHTIVIKKHMRHPVYWIKEGRKILREKNNKIKERLRQ